MNTVSIILGILLLAVLVALLLLLKKTCKLSRRNQELSSSLKIQEEGIRQLSSVNEALHEERHDYRNQLLVLSKMSPKEAARHLESLLSKQLPSIEEVHTGDSTLDAILSVKIPAAREAGITFDYAVTLPGKLPLSSIALCSIICNLLDNAMEACRKIPEAAQRFIHFTVDRKKDLVLFIVTNSILPAVPVKLSLETTKKDTDGHGFGLASVQATAEENDGTVSFEKTKDTFTVRVMIQAGKDFVS